MGKWLVTYNDSYGDPWADLFNTEDEARESALDRAATGYDDVSIWRLHGTTVLRVDLVMEEDQPC